MKYAPVAYKSNGIDYRERWACRDDPSWRYWVPGTKLPKPSQRSNFCQEEARWDFLYYNPQTGQCERRNDPDEWMDYINWPED